MCVERAGMMPCKPTRIPRHPTATCFVAWAKRLRACVRFRVSDRGATCAGSSSQSTASVSSLASEAHMFVARPGGPLKAVSVNSEPSSVRAFICRRIHPRPDREKTWCGSERRPSHGCIVPSYSEASPCSAEDASFLGAFLPDQTHTLSCSSAHTLSTSPFQLVSQAQIPLSLSHSPPLPILARAGAGVLQSGVRGMRTREMTLALLHAVKVQEMVPFITAIYACCCCYRAFNYYYCQVL